MTAQPRSAGASDLRRTSSSRAAWRGVVLATTLAAVALATPFVARGQQATGGRPTDATDATAQADALDARATAVEDAHREPTDLRVSAALRERAALLRGATDARVATSLRWAALDRYYAGDTVIAGELMETAATRAAAMGQLVTAVHDYMDAANIAIELRRPAHASDLVESAIHLANSPDLVVGQRDALQGQITLRFRRYALPALASIAVVHDAQ